MTALKKILDNYTDTELAFLYKYNLKSYSPDTSDKIKKHIAARFLTENKMERLIAEHKFIDDYKERCTRCNSAKIQILDQATSKDIRYLYPTLDKCKAEGIHAIKQCVVCGSNEYSPESENVKDFAGTAFEYSLELLEVFSCLA